MKIYKKCPCCNKTMFLMLGSDFGNEIEFGSAFGSKDNIPHSDTNHEEDWECLAKFINCLDTNHGEVFISLSEKERGKIPESYRKVILEWTEGGYKEEEKPKTSPKTNQNIGRRIEDNKDWGNIHLDFSRDEDYKRRWVDNGFTYQTCKEWMDIGLSVSDAFFAGWLRDKKKLSASQVLNSEKIESLREEWERSFAYFD